MTRTTFHVLVLLLLTSACMHGQGTTEERKDSWLVPAEASQRQNPVAPTEASLQRGRMLYQGNCYLCHGSEGHGDGPWVEQLPEKPADLADPERMHRMTDGELFWKISQGRDQMPRFDKQLSERERWDLVNYLRSLVREQRSQ